MKNLIIRLVPKISMFLICALVVKQSALAMENEVWVSPNGLGASNVAVTNVSSTDVVYGDMILYPSNVIGTTTYPFRCPTAQSLETVMTSVLTNQFMTIHFMAGTFEVPSNGITPLTGWKLRGAGIDNTVLQLVAGTPPASASVNVIGGLAVSPNENVEVSDMTIDCNMQNQTYVTGKLNAVGLWGSNTRISRVKAINWGTSSSTAECFVFYINPSSGNVTATNCVIEDCIVTQPAAYSGSAGVTAISIAPNIRTGIARNNLVYNVQTGIAGAPAHLNALAAQNIVSHNYVFDVTGSGGYAAYLDTWNPRDILLEDNVFDNVNGGVFFNAQANYLTNVVLRNNVIRPAEGGTGISYYTGEYNNTSAFVTNLIVKDNIIYPSETATNVEGLGLDSYITADVMGNILQGGGTLPDVWIDYQTDPIWWQSIYPYPVQLNTWAGNVNFNGTQLRMANDLYFEPGDEDAIIFTPTNSGWYRIVTGSSGMASTITIDSDLWDNNNTDTEFWYHVTGYGSTTNDMGEIVESRRGSYNDGSGQVNQARIGCDGVSGSGVYLDIYIPIVDSNTRFFKIKSKGHLRSKLNDPPIYNPPTPSLSITNNL